MERKREREKEREERGERREERGEERREEGEGGPWGEGGPLRKRREKGSPVNRSLFRGSVVDAMSHWQYLSAAASHSANMAVSNWTWKQLSLENLNLSTRLIFILNCTVALVEFAQLLLDVCI